MATGWTTGICLGKRRLEWTVLRRAKDAWTVERRGTCAWTPGETSPELKAAASQWRGELAAGLGLGDALLKVARLPGTDPDELRGMAEFQADRYSPWPMDGVGSGVEILETGAEEGVVALGLARLDAIEAAGEPFRALGAPLDAMDLGVLGWWRMLKDSGALPEKGDWLGVRVAGGPGEAAEALFGRDGMPLWGGELGIVPGDEPADPENGDAPPPPPPDLATWASQCAEDARYALTALEAEWGAEPGNATLRGGVWAAPGGEEAASALASALNLELHATGDADAAASPSEGLARRQADRGQNAAAAAMDLAPASWAEAEAERRFRRNFWRIAAAVLLLWAAGVATFLTLLSARRSQLSRLQKEVASLEAPALDVRALRGKLIELAQYADRSASPLECLRVAVETMPDDIEMDSFTYTKGQDVKIRGNARNPTLVYTWQADLEADGLFPEVKMDGVTKRNDQHSYGLTLVLPGGEEGTAEGGQQ